MPGESRKPDCLLFALKEEWQPFQQKTAKKTLIQGNQYWSDFTGVGTRNAATHTEQLLRSRTFRSIIVCGFAGGLTDDLLPGSIIVAATVKDAISHRTYRVDSALLDIAESARLSHLKSHSGMLATNDRVLIRSDEKRAFTNQSGAIAVDMESAGVADVAEKHQIPWIAVRAITDSVNDDLPFDFNALADVDGNVNYGRIVGAALLNPWKIPALIRLGKRSSNAARNLADFLEDFLNRLPE